MTTYGTIPTTTTTIASSSSGLSTNLDIISRAKERIESELGTRRPWKQMIHLQMFGLPSGFNDSISRIKMNTTYFRTNYVIIVSLILFLSLLWHPISLFVFVIIMAAWFFLYFLRDEPMVIMNRTIDDRVVLIVLAFVTGLGLSMAGAMLNIVVPILIGVLVVLVHAAWRKTEDLFEDEEEAVGLAKKRPLYEPSSSSSSSS